MKTSNIDNDEWETCFTRLHDHAPVNDLLDDRLAVYRPYLRIELLDTSYHAEW